MNMLTLLLQGQLDFEPEPDRNVVAGTMWHQLKTHTNYRELWGRP